MKDHKVEETEENIDYQYDEYFPLLECIVEGIPIRDFIKITLQKKEFELCFKKNHSEFLNIRNKMHIEKCLQTGIFKIKSIGSNHNKNESKKSNLSRKERRRMKRRDYQSKDNSGQNSKILNMGNFCIKIS
jgi:hypothetical protein